MGGTFAVRRHHCEAHKRPAGLNRHKQYRSTCLATTAIGQHVLARFKLSLTPGASPRVGTFPDDVPGFGRPQLSKSWAVNVAFVPAPCPNHTKFPARMECYVRSTCARFRPCVANPKFSDGQGWGRVPTVPPWPCRTALNGRPVK